MRLIEMFYGLTESWNMGSFELREGILETVFMEEMSCGIMSPKVSRSVVRNRGQG